MADGTPAVQALATKLKMAQLSDTAASSVSTAEDVPSGSEQPDQREEAQDEVVLHKIGQLRGHESRIFTAEFSPKDDGLLVTCSEDTTCRVWDVAQEKQILVLSDHTDAIYSATWSPDGQHLLTGASDGKIILWDAHSGRNKRVFEPGGDVFGATFLGNDSIVSASDEVVTIWDLQTGMRRQSRKVLPATDYVFGGRSRNPDASPWVFCLQTCEEHGVLALGVSDATVRVWDFDLEERVVFRGHAKDVCSLKIKDDGSELISGSGDTMAGVWDLRGLRARLVLKGHSGSVHDSCYLPGSGEICTASNDRTLRMWDPSNGAPLGQHGPGVTAQLCCAASHGLGGIAVGGGENKSIFGGDFRVALLSADARALDSFKEGREAAQRSAHVTAHVAAGEGAGDGGAATAEGAGGEGGAAAGEEEEEEGMRAFAAQEGGLAAVCKMSEEEIEDLSLKERLDAAKKLAAAAAAEEWVGVRGKLLAAALRVLFDVDEDAPKHAQEQLEALQQLQSSLGGP